MHIAAVGTALPPHRYEQAELIAAFTRLWSRQHHNPRRVEQLHQAVQVGGRNLALSIPEYEALSGFGASNAAWIRVGLDVGERAVRAALAEAGLLPSDVDAIFFTTVTGIAAPSLDARLVNRLGLRPDIKRTPMFGLGCVAGVAGVARMADYLRAFPDHVAVLLSVELCSLTLQPGDLSVPNLIATGLFGDGAAAVVGVGERRAAALGGLAGPRVVASKSRFYPDTEGVMGWEVGDRGFGIVLAATVPDMVLRYLGDDVAAFLAEQGVPRERITSWVCHPGGPKVLTAFEAALGVTEHDLALTWRSLRDIGNLSSSSVLFVLRDTMRERRPDPGELGLMIAMGPGFCAEMALVAW
jgi:alkylresorcinol/alkylpyrone synthase